MNRDQINIIMLNICPRNKKTIKNVLEQTEDINYILKFHNKLNKTLLKNFKTGTYLIIIDIENSGIDGLNILDDIATYNLPVIILSNNYDEKVSKLAFEKGVDDYILSDEINSISLIRTIKHSIRRNRAEKIKGTGILDDFFSHAPIGFHIFGPDKIISEINQAELDIIGYDHDEIIGKKTWADLIVPEQKKRFNRHWNDLKKNGNVSNLEYTVKHKMGHNVEVLLNASVRFDNNGKIINTRGSILDITKRKQYESKISELAKYPDENPNPIIRVNKQGVVIYANKGSTIILNEWGCKIGDILPEHMLKEVIKTFNKGISREIEFHCSGQYCLSMLSPVKDTDYLNIYGTLITKRREAELELLEYKNQLEDKVKERTEELTGLNEQLKNEIQERKASDSALMDSEEKFRNISSSAPDAIVMVDRNEKITFWNESAETIFGYTQEEILGKKMRRILAPERFHEDFQKVFYKLLKTVKGKEIGGNRETICLKKDGSEFPVEISISSTSIKNKWNGIGIIRDISERKKIEMEIKRLATVIEQANETILITDIYGNIEYANPHFKKTTGYDAKDVIGKNPSILSSGKQDPEIYREMWETIKSGNIWNGEFVNKKKDGTLYDEEAIIFPIKNDNGNVINFAAVKRDITERKQNEKKLVRLSMAVDQSLNIIMITDKETRIDYVNPKFTDITGYSPEEVIGRKASILGERTPEQKNKFWDILKKEDAWDGEFHNIKKNGDHYWEFASISAIKDSKGNVINFLKVGVDITKRKIAEKELSDAKKEAEKANMIKSEFLANMSHEIRTPMNSILGFVGLLEKTSLDEKQNKYLSIITKSSNTLLDLINDVLDITKIESGKLEIEKIEFSPVNEFEPVYEFFILMATQKNIEFIIFIDPELPELIIGDSMRIKQVLINLIGNAIKFTNENGRIDIEIELIKTALDYCRINFSVSDNGIGISEDKQKKIFKSFSQADGSITRKFGGTGLGLSISSNLVKMMGSRLNLKSSVNGGSRFYFELEFRINKNNNISFAEKFINEQYNCTICSAGDISDVQFNNLSRYLKSLKCNVKMIPDISQLKAIPVGHIIFIDQTALNDIKLKKILTDNINKSFVILSNDKAGTTNQVENEKNVKMLNYPVTLTKILRSINPGYKNKIPSNVINESFEKELHGLKVLVVEDNDINQELISIIFQDIGIAVDIAGNGLEAINKFKINKYDLILMDINMPVMDGKEATKEILKIEKEETRVHTPIIALTADVMSRAKDKFQDIGMDGYLSKPVKEEDLLQIFKNIKISDNKILKNELEEKAREIGIKHDILIKLVNKFRINSVELLGEIDTAIKEEDYKSIFDKSHKMKGAALNLRFNEISSITEKIEQSAKNKNNDGIKNNFNKLIIEIENLKNILC